MFGERGRLKKARQRARHLIRQARHLVARHGERVGPEHRAEVEAATAALAEVEAAAALSRPEGGAEAFEVRVEAYDALLAQRFGRWRKSAQREYIESIVVAVGIALFLRAFIIEAFTIPSGSMIPTLAVGDFLFVNKLSYGVRIPFMNRLLTSWAVPERGDVVVFVYPCDEKLDYIKRVVGLPGDEIYVDREGFVSVNGEAVSEATVGAFAGYDEFRGSEPDNNNCGPDLVVHRATLTEQRFDVLHCGGAEPSPPPDGSARSWDPNSRFRQCPPAMESMRYPWKVPEGHVFVMGDNRRNSADSRFWGFVPLASIKGKAMFIWMSWNGARPFSRPWEKVRWGRLFSGVHRDPG